MKRSNPDCRFRRIPELWLFPIVFYLIAFCLLTYPLIFRFRTHFFSEFGDGLQNAWNLWWINKAITELHQSPLFTTYLHYPEGTSLLGHTLGLFNGFSGIVLQQFLTMIETYNVIIVFAFVLGGYTAFRLALCMTRSYWSSLIAGWIFTFSQYHFAHAEGHMNLVSIEWIPLFILCWYRLVTDPRISKAIASGFVLFAVLLCDNYYFLYCVFSAILIVLWNAVSTGNPFFFLNKKHLSSFGAFSIVCLGTCGFLIFPLLRLTSADPFSGAHNPLDFSLDLPAIFIPGGHWRFAGFTEFYWSNLPGNIHENSVCIGLSVLFLLWYAWHKRQTGRLEYPSFSLWYVILLFFGTMALGPALQIAGEPVYTGIMPYSVLECVFPPLKMSGVPVRMMVMVTLAASVIGAMGLKMLFRKPGILRSITGSILGIILVVDTLPAPMPTTAPQIPPYMDLLKHLPLDGGLMDTVNPTSIALYYQTIHEKPLADGYISRYPASVFSTMKEKYLAFNNRDFFALSTEFNVRYLLTSSVIGDSPCVPAIDALYDSEQTRVYRLDRYRNDPELMDLVDVKYSHDYLGYIDHFNGHQISGWAVIPGMNAVNSRIYVLLTRQNRVIKIPVCREFRPDVSGFHQVDGLYDESGFTVDLRFYRIPDGIYRIAIYVENQDRQALGMTGFQFQQGA